MKKKLFIFLTVILLLVPILANAQTEWSYNRDTDNINYGTEHFTREYLRLGDGLLPEHYNVYKVEDDGEVFYLHQRDDNYDLVVLSDYPSTVENFSVHLSVDGKKAYEKFLNGEFFSYMLFDESASYTAGFNGAYVKSLDDINPTMDMPVSSLQHYSHFDVAGIDETKSLYHIHGAIYDIYNNYYYINYDALDNSYFDANGNFSYRRGNVKLARVPENISRQIRSSVSNFTYKYNSYTTTYDAYNTANKSISEIALFVISTAILGYVLPLVPFILSLVFAQSKKAVYPKRWYLLTICSVLWMILATCIVVLLLLS